jgi:hypothetical protein
MIACGFAICTPLFLRCYLLLSSLLLALLLTRYENLHPDGTFHGLTCFLFRNTCGAFCACPGNKLAAATSAGRVAATFWALTSRSNSGFLTKGAMMARHNLNPSRFAQRSSVKARLWDGFIMHWPSGIYTWRPQLRNGEQKVPPRESSDSTAVSCRDM